MENRQARPAVKGDISIEGRKRHGCGTDRKIASACKGADVAVGKGLAIEGNVAQKNQSSAQTSVNNWLERLGFKK